MRSTAVELILPQKYQLTHATTARTFPARQAGYAQEAIKNPPLLTGLVSVFSEDGLETEALYSTAAAASTPGHMAAN